LAQSPSIPANNRAALIYFMPVLIAAHALSLSAVTKVREFERIPGLVVESWM